MRHRPCMTQIPKGMSVTRPPATVSHGDYPLIEEALMNLIPTHSTQQVCPRPSVSHHNPGVEPEKL